MGAFLESFVIRFEVILNGLQGKYSGTSASLLTLFVIKYKRRDDSYNELLFTTGMFLVETTNTIDLLQGSVTVTITMFGVEISNSQYCMAL